AIDFAGGSPPRSASFPRPRARAARSKSSTTTTPISSGCSSSWEPDMTTDTKTAQPPKRSLAHRAAKALGFDEREHEDEGEIVPNAHIGVGSSFRGTLMIEGTLLVDGDFEGDILNCERIVVGTHGSVRADLHVREAIVAGAFEGGIQAEERILLLSGA